MKKYIPGFVPADYKKVGQMLLVIGSTSLAINFLSNLIDSFSTPKELLYFGAGLIVLSFYLLFVVPPEE